MLDYSIEYKEFIAISGVDAANLCSSSLCWDIKKTQKCKKCSRCYCQGHFVNHGCIRNFGGWN